MSTYNIIAETKESTVVSEYTPELSRSESYQSEAALENEFIRILQSQGYQYIPIKEENDLIKNLRVQLENLNDYKFSDDEWERFFNQVIANPNDGIEEKSNTIQSDNTKVLIRDDGTSKNIKVIDKKNIHNNSLQVINQYEEKNGARINRYDVTVLVNGLPMVHIELKRRGVSIKEAFNQINRSLRDSFWASKGLYEYIQIFVISNGTITKYYSNTTRVKHVEEMNSVQKSRAKKAGNTFEFTSFWADSTNKIIPDLVDFARTFFAKHTLLNIITKYCVFTSEKKLMVMRPYQIAATERIINKIETSTNYKQTGTIEAGGYIWHTTGSGKTLTSFKTAQLATSIASVDKVLFVVDRKDLDYQTIKEYEKFEKGAANGNNNTKVLQSQLENPSCRIIITTIQKLDTFIKKNKNHEVYKKHCVLIFDECHRSQFGEMHNQIIKAFRNYHIFGFTGTPIIAKNITQSSGFIPQTTDQLFGARLHTYTIVDAINDENVLPFRIDYINTIKERSDVKDKDVKAIDSEKALDHPERVKEIVSYIIDHFDQKTKRNENYSYNEKRLSGFNSMLAVSSIPMDMKYYYEFKKQLEEKHKDLVIATIFSFAPNEEDPSDGILSEEEFETEALDKTSRDFLDEAIADYNKRFGTNFDTSSKLFQNYYKDLSKRVKDKEVDLLIVVNMFLTGFDAPTLNTLWVDKNLKMHGLIQAFSRTNRILNQVKTFGNIVCFRNLQEETDEAIALFGDKSANGIVLLKRFEDYLNGFDDESGRHHAGYEELLEKLRIDYPLGTEIVGEKSEKDFIKLFSSLLKVRNILTSFDQFKEVDSLSKRDLQDYQSIYISLYEKYRKVSNADKEDITDDIEFELELIKQVEINIDYILMLVEKYHDGNCEDKEIIANIMKSVESSIQLRSKKALIEAFINRVNVETQVDSAWNDFIYEQEKNDLDEIIESENLKEEETLKFVNNVFKDGSVKTYGTDLDRIMPPVSRFGGKKAKKKQSIIEKLSNFFDKYNGLGFDYSRFVRNDESDIEEGLLVAEPDVILKESL